MCSLADVTCNNLVTQVMVKEHYSMHTSADRRVAELETSLAEKNVRLESYYKLESELDDVVLQAAEGTTFTMLSAVVSI